MQIKSGQRKKISQNYNNQNNINNKRNNNIYYPRKIIINNTSDLYKLPVDVIKNSKIYNFTGNYFNEIYEEALKIERSNEIKKLINNFDDSDSAEGEKYAKAIEDIANRIYSQNLISEIKIEQIDNNIYSFNDKEITLKFDNNGKLKLLDGTDLEQWIIYTFHNN